MIKCALSILAIMLSGQLPIFRRLNRDLAVSLLQILTTIWSVANIYIIYLANVPILYFVF